VAAGGAVGTVVGVAGGWVGSAPPPQASVTNRIEANNIAVNPLTGFCAVFLMIVPLLGEASRIGLCAISAFRLLGLAALPDDSLNLERSNR
jgi:hypothetical protein